MFRIVLLLLALALAVPASAATWFKWCGSQSITGLAAGEYACASPSANTDDTTILSVGACENFDVFQFDDKDGSGSVSLVAGTPELCPDSVLTSADDGCAPIPGTSALSGDDAIYGAAGMWVRIEAGGTNTNPTQMRWIVKCAQPANR